MKRSFLMAWMATLILIVGGVGVLAWAHATPVPTVQALVVFTPHEHRAPDFTLPDQNGQKITISQIAQKKIVAITFLDTYCTQQCPVVARQFAQVQKLVGTKAPLTLLIVSVAPYHDTAASAAAFARKAGWTGEWHWLFGTQATLQPIWKAYGIYVQIIPPSSPIFKTQFNLVHTAAVYLIDHTGYMRTADMVPLTPTHMATSVEALDSQAHPQTLLEMLHNVL